MFGAITKRTLLALIPIAVLTTAGLALTGLTQFPAQMISNPTDDEAAQTAPTTPPPAQPAATAPTKTLVAQSDSTVQPEQVAQAAQQEEDNEPLPALVVDKTALTQAMADLDRATAQAKLAVTALDGTAQQRYIQEAINLLAGVTDPNFRMVAQAGSQEGYKGVRPLLIEARVIREAAEVQWVAAVQRQLEARARRQAELAAQAGSGGGTALQPAPASVSAEIAAIVGPTGVMGTRGVRPEEQALDLVTRAIKQAAEALRMASNRPQGSLQDGTIDLNHASDEATQAMEAVLRILDSAKKIIQIAADR